MTTVFFDTTSPKQAALMEAFDDAAQTYKNAALGYLATAAGLCEKNVSFIESLEKEKNLIQKTPLPSEANSSSAAFNLFVQLGKEELKLRQKVQEQAENLTDSKAGDKDALQEMLESMQTSAEQTVGRPEFAEIHYAMAKAVFTTLKP